MVQENNSAGGGVKCCTPGGTKGRGVSYWGSIGVEDTHHPPSNRETLTLKNVFSALFIIYVHRVSQIHICSKGVQILNSSCMFQGCPNFKFIIYVYRVSQFKIHNVVRNFLFNEILDLKFSTKKVVLGGRIFVYRVYMCVMYI